MRVLVIGSGAREHALVARLSADRDVGRARLRPRQSRASPRLARTVPVDLAEPRRAARARRPRADRPHRRRPRAAAEPRRRRSLRRRRAGCSSARRAAAARLESSKAFAKAFMARHGVPTARFRTCESLDEALRVRALRRVRLSRRAQGRRSRGRQGRRHRRRSRRAPKPPSSPRWRDRRFGAAGDRLVIEECLTGPEVSFFVVVRRHARAAPRDRRRITSASSTTTADRTPAAWARSRRARWSTPALEARVMREIVEPVIAGHGGGRTSVPRLPLRRPDADAGRPEGDRVQRAARRSGGAGDPAAHRRAAAAAARRRGAGRRAPPGSCRLGARPPRRRRARVARLSRSRPSRVRPIHGHRRRRSDCRACRCFTPAPRCATGSS